MKPLRLLRRRDLAFYLQNSIFLGERCWDQTSDLCRVKAALYRERLLIRDLVATSDKNQGMFSDPLYAVIEESP